MTLGTNFNIRAADWPKDAVWSGGLKIISRGREAFILLIDEKKTIFAKCHVDEGSVERSRKQYKF